jgi:hypothetical protein
MACPNFKNGPKKGLGPLGVKEELVVTDFNWTNIILKYFEVHV